MLARINELLADQESFAFETTLATRSYKSKILTARQQGYSINLLFFWLQNTELAKERLKTRVAEGGHSIDPAVIERRYYKGIVNLFDIYLPLVDGAWLFDNSAGKHELMAQKIAGTLTLIDELRFNNLKKYYDDHR